MSGMKIEAVFGGVLALVVLAVAVFAVVKTQFGQTGPTSGPPRIVDKSDSTPVRTVSASSSEEDAICQCFDQAFSLAGKVDVLSPDYRTGFEQCRAVAGVDGGNAWTAGWNARLSSKPFEASCKAWRKRPA